MDLGRVNQLEFSITDACNRNCKGCSHFAPLAKKPNFVKAEDFEKDLRALKQARIIPDSLWLIGGEPTLHKELTLLLAIAKNIYGKTTIGVMTNGTGFKNLDWDFVRDNGIVFHVTTYDVPKAYFENLFERNGCLNHLSLDVRNKFYNIVHLSGEKQPASASSAKYIECGCERSGTFVRNGRIWKCATAEYIDLFNGYFNENFEPEKGSDYLDIDGSLTLDGLLEFKNRPGALCEYCDLASRFKESFIPSKSERIKSEWTQGD